LHLVDGELAGAGRHGTTGSGVVCARFRGVFLPQWSGARPLGSDHDLSGCLPDARCSLARRRLSLRLTGGGEWRAGCCEVPGRRPARHDRGSSPRTGWSPRGTGLVIFLLSPAATPDSSTAIPSGTITSTSLSRAQARIMISFEVAFAPRRSMTASPSSAIAVISSSRGCGPARVPEDAEHHFAQPARPGPGTYRRQAGGERASSARVRAA